MKMPLNYPDIHIEIHREQVPVAMMSPSQVADEKWKYVDKKGHGHFWEKDKLPTLEWFVTGTWWAGDEYDGCEYEEGEWRCRLCKEVIEPKRRAEYGPWSVPGPTTVTLTIDGVTFHLTPEQYAESVKQWARLLRGSVD